MKEVTVAEVLAVTSASAIAMTDPRRGIGRTLNFTAGPIRTLVVHLVESDPSDYVTRVVGAILRLEDSWFLLPRHGSASQLGFPVVRPDVAAFEFRDDERDALCDYLCTRDMSIGAVSCDLYAVAGRSGTVVTWDHHTADEGLVIQSRDIELTGRLLVELNAIGTELEVFYTDGQPGRSVLS